MVRYFKNISDLIQKNFNENGSDIIIQCNMKTVNYLVVTLNYKNSTDFPYHKQNNQIKYIITESNHPPSTIKQLPISVKYPF